jgi:hypothetical protein
MRIARRLKYPEWADDSRHIQSVLKENGYDLSLEDCEYLWIQYSDGLCAMWMMLPKDDKEIIAELKWIIDALKTD